MTTGRRGGAELERSITQSLTQRIGPHKFDMWFGNAEVHVSGEQVQVTTDSAFVARWIDSHFAGDLRSAARETLGGDAVIEVKVKPEDAGTSSKPGRDEDGAGSRTISTSRERRPTSVPRPGSDAPGGHRRVRDPRRAYRRLDQFVVGQSNRLAHSAATQMVDDEQSALISPLFVHGECGVGKTHLLQGICRRFAEQTGRPQAARYITGEQFTNDYITAIRGSSLDQFRQRMRKVELLVIDDVHFLSNKVRTQSEFLHTLDALDLSGARIVLASDEHPRHIKRFSQALISRFLSGMVVKVERPDRDTRETLVRQLASQRGLNLGDSAIDSIAGRCVGSVRELEGMVTKLNALHTITGNGVPEVGHVLVEQLFTERAWQPAAPVRIGQVIDVVCERLRCARSDLMGTGRHRKVVLGRALVAHLGREMTTHSYPEIAQAIGRTYHSTVHTAAARLRRQLEADETVDLGPGEPAMKLRDLTDQLRHAIVRAAGGTA
jgi:chromosomal replication initiator protein